MGLFIKRSEQQRVQDQYEGIMKMTGPEKQALYIFQKNLVPVYFNIRVDPYRPDFTGVVHNFILEIDGFTHDISGLEDDRRSKFLDQRGFNIFRLPVTFTETDILNVVNQAEFVGYDFMKKLIQDANGHRY